jgi:hypothetical protein
VRQEDHMKPHRSDEAGESVREMSHIDQKALLVPASIFENQLLTGGQRSLINL